jgi:hypothetical protein
MLVVGSGMLGRSVGVLGTGYLMLKAGLGMLDSKMEG